MLGLVNGGDTERTHPEMYVILAVTQQMKTTVETELITKKIQLATLV